MSLEVRIVGKRCLCWLSHGKHQLTFDPFTHRLICQHCGGDGHDAMAASEEYQQAWTEYTTDDWLRDERERGDRVQTPSRLALPRRIVQQLRGTLG